MDILTLSILYFGQIPHEYLNSKSNKENYSNIAKQFITKKYENCINRI